MPTAFNQSLYCNEVQSQEVFSVVLTVYGMGWLRHWLVETEGHRDHKKGRMYLEEGQSRVKYFRKLQNMYGEG